jgi:histidinol phosphatase-like enzyme
MFKLAKKKWKIDLKNSFMIGDQSSDMEFAKRAQIKGYLFKQENLLNFLINKKIL